MNSTNTLKLLSNKEFLIILFLFICSASSNSVFANPINPNLSKNKSNILNCQQYIEFNSKYYCWNGIKYVKTAKLNSKEEINK